MSDKSRWTEYPFLRADKLTPEQLNRVMEIHHATQEYYRTGNPDKVIEAGIWPKDSGAEMRAAWEEKQKAKRERKARKDNDAVKQMQEKRE